MLLIWVIVIVVVGSYFLLLDNHVLVLLGDHLLVGLVSRVPVLLLLGLLVVVGELRVADQIILHSFQGGQVSVLLNVLI